MGNIFPFEFGLLPLYQIEKDKSLIKVQDNGIPLSLQVFVESKIRDDLNNPMIIDFVSYNDTTLIFLPPIPKSLEEYDLYQENPQD